MESVIESFRVCRLSAPFFCALIKSFFHCFLSVSVLPSLTSRPPQAVAVQGKKLSVIQMLNSQRESLTFIFIDPQLVQRH